MKVPFVDLQAHHDPIRAEIGRVIGEVIDSGAFSGGLFVEKFEERFAAYCGTSHAIGVGSGTDALWLALMASGIGPGDEVITVTMSFIATAEAISMTGATPVFVDIDPLTYTMDVAAMESAITRRTRAIVPVHLFGQNADMPKILTCARKHGLLVIEDAAQAHGAMSDDCMAGSSGHAGCYSFYPGKNLGGLGEGGAVVTNDVELSDKIRMLRNHGQARKHHHPLIGWNSRMDGIQAAVLDLKLTRLDRDNALRRGHAARYTQALSEIPEIITPASREDSGHVFHIYAIQTSERGDLAESFDRHRIGYGFHYPVPIHLQPAYHSLGYRKSAFPVAERCAERFISLPMFPELTSSQIDTVADLIGEFFHAPSIS